MNQVKLRFFTNISHEFRTPLTLIIGQIENLLQLNKLSPSMYNRLLRIYKNASHMRTLISELLDFRKQEQGYLKLKVECRDIVAFTKDLIPGKKIVFPGLSGSSSSARYNTSNWSLHELATPY